MLLECWTKECGKSNEEIQILWHHNKMALGSLYPRVLCQFGIEALQWQMPYILRVFMGQTDHEKYFSVQVHMWFYKTHAFILKEHAWEVDPQIHFLNEIELTHICWLPC